jgi:hypothetical protein
MSANKPTETNRDVNVPDSTAPAEPSKFASGMKVLAKLSPYFFAIFAAAAYGFSFYNTSQFIGDAEIWNTLKPQITKILLSCMVGTAFLMIGAFLYFLQDQTYMMYFLLFLTFTTLALSYASLAIAAILSK